MMMPIVVRVAMLSRYLTAARSTGCAFLSFALPGAPASDALFALEKKAVSIQAPIGIHAQFGLLKIFGPTNHAMHPITTHHVHVERLVSASKSALPKGASGGAGVFFTSAGALFTSAVFSRFPNMRAPKNTITPMSMTKSVPMNPQSVA